MIPKISPAEIDDRENVFREKIIYDPRVQVGFWLDESGALDVNDHNTAYKRDRGQLLIQKVRAMLGNMLKSTELALESPFVRYGENYQIKSCEIKHYDGRDMFLSGTINEREMERVQHFVHGCEVTASPLANSVVRNTFRLVPGDPEKDGGQVLFGDDVFIEISGTCGLPLYVQFHNADIATLGVPLTLKLSQDPDLYCRFKFFHGDPKLRNRTIGGIIRPLSRILIQHTASGQNLAMEPKRWIRTFCGPEMQVWAHTYRDARKKDGPENFWEIVPRQVADIE